MPFTRRQSLKLGLIAAASTVLSAGPLFSIPAAAATNLTGAYYIPASYEVLSSGPAGFIKYLKDNASDKVNIDFYDSGQLVKADEQLPALRSGSIDFMFHTISYITRSVPVLGITGLPGVVDELYKHPERLAIGSPLFNLINEELAKENLYMLSLGGGILEPEYIWSTEASPIRSLADLDGKKVRVVSYEATQVLAHYHAAAVRIPSSETYLALQRGTVDAGVFNISTVIGRSLHEQLAYCYKLPSTAFTIAPFMLRDRWDALDTDTRAALQEAAQWYNDNFVGTANTETYPNKFWPKVTAAGVEIIEPSAEDMASFNEATHSVWDKWKEEVGEDLGTRAIELALGKE
jgi:TRAP-type transport system periplasmic protein